jgi:hypothetical protein
MAEISKEDLIYIAGFFDGEGCVSILKRKDKHHTDFTYSLIASIAQKNPSPLEEIINLFGFGKLHYLESTKNYSVLFAGKFADDFLCQIIPYLRIKKDQAVLGIEFRKNTIRKIGKWESVGEEMVNLREEYYLKMKSMKKPHMLVENTSTNNY